MAPWRLNDGAFKTMTVEQVLVKDGQLQVESLKAVLGKFFGRERAKNRARNSLGGLLAALEGKETGNEQ